MNVDPITIVVTGLFNGLGTAVGSYFGAKYAVTQIEKHKKTIKKIIRRGQR